MKEPVILMSESPVLNTLNFKPFRSMLQRNVVAFLPRDEESQSIQVKTPWGTLLTAKRGDFLVSELDAPSDVWPVNPEIFDQSYMITEPGHCIKRAVTLLVPLTEVTNGDEDQMVTVHTLEGVETVRAGDFFLAKGVRGEIWPYPKEKALAIMKPVE